MSSPQPSFAFRCDFSRWAASAVVLTMLGLSGCAAVSERSPAELLAEAAPRATLVADGTQMFQAERSAAEHEGDFVLSGAGNSMMPLYRSGTVIVVHPTSFFMLRPGMPVVYLNRFGTPVAHVLVERLSDGWIVAGVNNAEADDDLVTPRNLVGMVRCAYAAAGEGQISTVATVATAIGKGASNRFAALTW